jgi:hypothetical protein
MDGSRSPQRNSSHWQVNTEILFYIFKCMFCVADTLVTLFLAFAQKTYKYMSLNRLLVLISVFAFCAYNNQNPTRIHIVS